MLALGLKIGLITASRKELFKGFFEYLAGVVPEHGSLREDTAVYVTVYGSFRQSTAVLRHGF
jgi:hypothetical protein